MLLHDLRQFNSNLNKKLILKTQADLNDKEMFQYAYDMDRMYHLRFADINWDTVKPFNHTDRDILECLLERQVTGNAARALVEDYCSEHAGDLVKLICNKDLDCGVTATTLNKVFGKGFIPVFEVQLAEEVPLTNVSCPVVGQLKYNGTRVLAICTSRGLIFRTRNGKVFEYPKLKAAFTNPIGFVLDGELCFGDSQGSDHAKVSGIVNSAIKGTPIPDHYNLQYNVFDFLAVQDFNKQECHATYRDRFNDLNYLFGTNENPLVKLAMTWEFHTAQEIQDKFDQLLNDRYEGLILKSWDHKYSYKRSKDWIKVKAIKSADLRCEGIKAGADKYEGAIGALICRGIVEGKHIAVKVSSGLTDEDRWADHSDYLKHTIEVKYNTVIQDKTTGEWSLFLPRFVTVRGDK